MKAVWLLGIDGNADVQGDVGRALAAEGCRPLDDDLSAAAPAGIVIAGRDLHACVDLIRSTCRHGLTRVLVAACSPEPPEIEQTWNCIDAGAADVIWSADIEALKTATLERIKRWFEIEDVVTSRGGAFALQGRSPRWVAALRQVAEAAIHSSAPVLLLGESGTGKEMLARWAHSLDRRPHKRAFVVLDCSSVEPALSGSEFFGHERGAFTGAVTAREGAFELANGGTLFLDEVGELTSVLQGELLRVVQEGTFKRLGSNTWRETRFRLICATNRDLQEEEAAGRFRRDFYHRIAGSVLKLPALRERPEDVLLLAEHFLMEDTAGESGPRLDAVTRQFLLDRAYPGNVRELKQLVTQLRRRHVGPGPITVGDIPESERDARSRAPLNWRDAQFDHAILRALDSGVGLREIAAFAADAAIRLAMEAEGGSLKRAAAKLGVTDRALQLRKANRRVGGRLEEAC